MSAVGRMLRLLRGRAPSVLPAAAFWCLVLVALESVGGAFEGDLADAGVIAFLIGLAALTLSWLPREQGAGPLQRLWKGLLEWLARWKFELGVDLRVSPAPEPGLPGLMVRPLVLILVLVALLLLAHDALPGRARGLVVGVSYGLWLLLLVLVWAALVGGSLMLLAMTHLFIHDGLVTRHTGQETRPLRPELILHATILAALAAMCLLLPPWLPVLLLASLAAVLVTVLALPAGPDVALLWRSRARGGKPRGLRLRTFMLVEYVLYFGTAAVLLLLSRGDRLLTESDAEVMQVTPALGLVFAWSAVIGMTALSLRTLRALAIGRFRNPEQDAPRILHVSGELHGTSRRQLRRQLAAHDWLVRFAPSRAHSCDVQVVLTDDAPYHGEFGQEVRWPLHVTPEELTEETTLRRCDRRRELQCRRLLVRGLKRLFKRAARRKWKRGEGFWVGPHLWFVSGLSRDQTEDEHDFAEDAFFEEIIGPPYHRVLQHPVRNHFNIVLRALQVDLIFVEDGVGFRRFRRVLDNLFELFDISGDSQPAQERHFLGLPGVRVVLHDFDMENPYESKVYPEPDYEDVGRARVLHVFVDRGGDEEPVPDPVESDSLPVLQGV